MLETYSQLKEIFVKTGSLRMGEEIRENSESL